MIKRFTWLAPLGLFAIAFTLALAALAPASLVTVLVERLSNNRLTLAGAAGSLWRGEGIVLARSDGARVFIAWSLAPSNLIAAKLAGTLIVGAEPAASFVGSPDSLELDQVDFTLPAAIVAEALGAYGGYRIGGVARLHGSRALLHRDSAQARLTLEWDNASSALIAVAPLGSYVAEIDWRGSTGTISVRSKEGPLKLDGAGRWSHDGAALVLDAQPTGERAETLKAWLRTLTPEQPGGRFRFTWPAPQRGTPRS